MKSKLLSLFVVCALVTSLFVGPAAAVKSSTGDLPEEAEVGTDVEATFEFTQLFDEFEQWTLQGETELQSVTWTVRQYDQAGNQVSQTSADGQQLSAQVDIEDGTSRIEVRVTGTAPPIENYSYDPPQRFVFANFTQARSGGTAQPIDGYQVHHYTAESKEARNAIDSASEAVNASSSDEGEAFLQSAISSYENENFQNAKESAKNAEDAASQDRLLMMGAIGVVALIVLVVLVGGGYRYYKSRQQAPNRLR